MSNENKIPPPKISIPPVNTGFAEVPAEKVEGEGSHGFAPSYHPRPAKRGDSVRPAAPVQRDKPVSHTSSADARPDDAAGSAPDPIFAALFELTSQRGTRVSLASLAEFIGVPALELTARFSHIDEIFVAFIADVFERAGREVLAIDGYGRFSLPEKLHTLLETILGHLEPHRELLPRIALRLGATALLRPTHLLRLRRHYASIVTDYFRAAIDEGEISDIDLDSTIIRSFADHASTVIVFWMRDPSPNHEATTEFIDQSLSIVIPAAVSTARMRGLSDFFRRQVQHFMRSRRANSSGGFRSFGFERAGIRSYSNRWFTSQE